MIPTIATIPAVAASAAERFADEPAVLENGETWTFGQLYREARRAASAFLANGIVRGDVIAIWAPNRREWIAAALGAQMAGGVITPLNTRLKGREAADILRRSRARLLISPGSFLGIDFPALLRPEALPGLRSHLVFEGGGPGSWESFVDSGEGPEDARVDAAMAGVGADDLSDIIYTSGTTGMPKGVLNTHGATVGLFRDWAETVGLRHRDRYAIVNPFFHTFGYKAGWLACLLVGATLLPIPVFDAGQTTALIEQQGVTFLPGPPTIFQALLAEQAARPRKLSSLRVAVTGAASVAPILVQRMQQELHIETVLTGYGMTECGTITLCRAGDSIERVANTCGRALPGLTIRCVDEEGREVGAGEVGASAVGEILVRGYGVMKGYLDDPVATAEAVDAQGWLHTGDIGALDREGYLRITDRKKDIFISGGFNCYPAEIEKLLCEHPAVETAAVVGVPDARLGEVGKAFVVLRPGRAVDAVALVAWARDNMANYKVPRVIEFCRELPRNAAGKVLRSQLRNNSLEPV